MEILGIKVSVYQSDGVTLHPSIKITSIKGGTVTSTPSCSKDDSVTLYDPKCNSNLPLDGETLWTFATVDKCRPAPFAIDPGEFFVLDTMKFTANLVGGNHPVGITLLFNCSGLCSSIPSVDTFTLTAPAE